MSVLIKGMEMPINCLLCPFCVPEADEENGDICIISGQFPLINKEERSVECPLVELPPHGRLIDADALHQLFEAQWHYLQCLDWDENPTAEYTQSGVNWCINTMHDEAPTIIPADRTEVSE